MRTQAEAVASHFGMDVASVRDCEYQPGKSVVKVFTLADDYYCAVKEGKKPPQTGRYSDMEWVEVKDYFVNHYGWKLFKHTI